MFKALSKKRIFSMRILPIALLLTALPCLAQTTAPAVPTGPAASTLRKDWIDPETGHHVYRLSVENGSGNLYFHYNAYSADGKKVVFNSPSGIMAADLATK